jgi:hypothetical protein
MKSKRIPPNGFNLSKRSNHFSFSMAGTMLLDLGSARVPRATDGVAPSVSFNHHLRTIR